MARVTGIGGVFLRSQDPKALAAWYAQHLGIQLNDWGGASFLWSDEVPPTTGTTAWSIFPADTEYFGAGTPAGPQAVMINYRVDDLEAMLAQLKGAGVAIEPHDETYPYGRFAWIVDPDGNRVELWEPVADDGPPVPA